MSEPQKLTQEEIRLKEDREREAYWRKWGCYSSDRQWGTVREDYSADGSAWDHFSFEQSHYRAYRWGEDGIAGISDNHQRLCFSLAMWNGNDPFLKERLYGLTNTEGNHGEDVKDYYFHLDNTPTHSYMKYLYKYPQKAFPYWQLEHENKKRGLKDREFELIETGIFDDDQYFDVTVEYAKESDENILIFIHSGSSDNFRYFSAYIKKRSPVYIQKSTLALVFISCISSGLGLIVFPLCFFHQSSFASSVMKITGRLWFFA